MSTLLELIELCCCDGCGSVTTGLLPESLRAEPVDVFGDTDEVLAVFVCWLEAEFCWFCDIACCSCAISSSCCMAMLADGDVWAAGTAGVDAATGVWGCSGCCSSCC